MKMNQQSGIVVNDIHSQLNSTRVHRIERPNCVEAIQAVIQKARREGRPISIAAGRHSMGGQQFGTNTVLLDMTGMNHVLTFDRGRGEIEVESGIEWPALIDYLLRAQRGQRSQWGIIQKQTGADRFSIGGSLATNIHGRGLCLKPIIDDVESFTLVAVDGNVRTCSRRENPELFALAIGGYGLFGIIVTVKLRLSRRQKLERVVKLIELDELMPSFESRINEAYLYGDFQYSTDVDSNCFLRTGVFSCYRPVDEETPVHEQQKELSEEEWKTLSYLAHVDRKQAFEIYSTYYLATSGQIYWSDTHQLSTYVDNYHQQVDQQSGAVIRGTEMITEIFVPRDALVSFMEDVRRDLRANQVDLVYGTIRVIEKDAESFLAWATEPYVCVIFNLHVIHNPGGLEKAVRDFRRLIDRGIEYGGSYFLTYHRWATHRQVKICYPRFVEMLRLKRKYDPEDRFQSDWYRHHKRMFGQK